MTTACSYLAGHKPKLSSRDDTISPDTLASTRTRLAQLKKDRDAKNQHCFKVGEWVRIALEAKVKGLKLGPKGPKQKWSGKTYQVTKVSNTEMYTLKGLARRRFKRYWL